MVINHNIAALNTHRQFGAANKAQAGSMEKLSSGMRINKAGDDAAGLAISEKMRGQIRGLDMATKNAQDATSLIQTAEGALNETHSILQRMRELAVQAANDTNADEDRDAIQAEIKQLTDEVSRIANETEFNTKKILDGSFSDDALNFQVGANSGQNINLTIKKMTATALGVSGIDTKVGSYTDATAAITTINDAIKAVSNQRSALGAVQNRLEHTIANADNTSENLQAAESRIRDVDMADEMVTYSKNNILQQAAQSMLAQANQSSQGVLSLLQ